MYHHGLLARFPGGLTRSARQEFEENEGGKWLDDCVYVVDQSAKEEYPSTKGEAPSEQLKPSFTRDKGRTGWTLEQFYDEQPAKQRSGVEAWQLSLAEVAILRIYTGPWFKAVNVWACSSK